MTEKPSVGDWTLHKNDDPSIGDVGTEYPYLTVSTAEDAHQGFVFTPRGIQLVTNYHQAQDPGPRPDGTSSLLNEPVETRADFESRIRAEALRDANTQVQENQNSDQNAGNQ